ncbi:MAG: ATP-binding cassette domain-containing protein [Rubrivivax sp.]|nr:ATP-binding cassette domain-containing protein [Rubrivivax sp.]
MHHLSGEFKPGSLTAVVGPNGAGKTSLLAAIAGSLAPAAGELRVGAALNGRIAWLPQQAAIDRSFPMKVFDLVALGHRARVGSFKAMVGAQREHVHGALPAVGLKGFERRRIG